MPQQTTTTKTKSAKTKKKASTTSLTLPKEDRAFFEKVLADSSQPQRARHRAQVLLLASDGVSSAQIRARWGCTERMLQLTIDRYRELGRESILIAKFHDGKPITYADLAKQTRAVSPRMNQDEMGFDTKRGIVMPENRLKRSDTPMSRFPWKLGCSTIVGGERELTKVCDGIPDKQLYDLADAWWDDKRGEGRITGSRKRYRSRAQFTADLAAKSRKTIVFGYEPRWMGTRFFWVGAGSVQKVLYPEALTESEKTSDISGTPAAPKDPEAPAPKRSDNDEQTFIDRCRHIARVQGKTNQQIARLASIGWGLNDKGAKVYDDEHITIVVEAEPSKCMLVIRKKNRNPICCTDKKGEAFRWHGEWHHLRDHVAVVHG